MFKSKTVFIVGAGASCEAGLPSGEDIKNNIAKLLNYRFSYERGREGHKNRHPCMPLTTAILRLTADAILTKLRASRGL